METFGILPLRQAQCQDDSWNGNSDRANGNDNSND
ncbi:hypothetical protein HDF10_003813 [Edaphobacter lichenicola]|uniref:Uncharacterized protein n=1 Tax=Tunturiibacter lichenicola TaxID=2051959 RepID=A0A7W8N4P3_9BACT|nr:hypothetical protein [Edaphobacter lichenicola]